MTTQYLPMTQYKANISHYVREARTHDIRYIVTSRSVPMFEILPIVDTRELVYPPEAHAKYLQAKKEHANGESISWKDIAHKFV